MPGQFGGDELPGKSGSAEEQEVKGAIHGRDLGTRYTGPGEGRVDAEMSNRNRRVIFGVDESEDKTQSGHEKDYRGTVDILHEGQWIMVKGMT